VGKALDSRAEAANGPVRSKFEKNKKSNKAKWLPIWKAKKQREISEIEVFLIPNSQKHV
jgi:hypothetical protein